MLVGQVGACGNGVDDDGDGNADFPLDADCASPEDDTEATTSPSANQCTDATDNDGDTLSDGADPDCLLDAVEGPEPAVGQCDDGVDNDGQNGTDFPTDVNCLWAADATEGPEPASGQCADSVDNDGDSAVDSADGDCSASLDETEGAEPRAYAVHADHLGTPRLLTDLEGRPVWRALYAAYGRAVVESGSGVEFNVRFPGQYFDGESGLHYNRHRYYDPSIGRYISADRIGQAAGTNLYTYALNNPISWLDFLGLTTWPGSSNRISSGFGPRNAPTPGASTNHAGVDVPNPVGGDVVASDSGEVVRTRQDVPGKANSVTVKHDDGSVASYSHVDSNVKVGDRVAEGQSIGKTDLSGNSTGGHVHYERYVPGVGKAVDPTSHLQGADPYPGAGPRNGSKEDCP